MSHRLYRAAFALLVTSLCSFVLLDGVKADEFPSKPIQVLVTTAAGGTGDLVARALGDRLSEQMGQPVIIENQSTANGGLAAAQVGRANPDGYTLLMTNDSTLTINPHLYKKLPFNPNDLQPVGTVAKMALVLTVASDSRFNTLQDLVADAKKNPGKLNYASTGVGTQLHIGMELFKLRTGTDIVHVPYRGNTGAMADLMGGRVDMILIGQPGARAQMSGGRIKILGIAAGERSEWLPDVPTFAEAGVQNCEVAGWYGVMASAKIPKPIIERLSQEIKKAAADPRFIGAIHKMGMTVVGSSPEEMETSIRVEAKKWAEVLDVTGTTIDQ